MLRACHIASALSRVAMTILGNGSIEAVVLTGFQSKYFPAFSHEASEEFLLEFRQRLLDQKLALGGAHRHVLEFGLEKRDRGDRYQMNASALVDRQVGACLGFQFAQHVEPQRRDGPDG